MQIAVFIKFLSAMSSPKLSLPLQMALLPFNPIKLIILIGWVYLCLYLVQRLQFSLLVPKNYKTLVNL